MHSVNNAYLEPADVARLEKAVSNLRDLLLIRLLFRLGCRVSEALALTVDDINLEEGLVVIQHLKTRIQLSCKCGARLGRHHAFCPACGAKVGDTVAAEQQRRRVRSLPLDRETAALVAEYIDRGGPVTKDGKASMFGISRHQAWRVVSDAARRAGLPQLVNNETGRLRK